MRATIGKAGRLVIPKLLRDRLGIRPGEVEVVADGSTLRIEPTIGTAVIEHAGRLFIPAAGEAISGEQVRSLRDADQR